MSHHAATRTNDFRPQFVAMAAAALAAAALLGSDPLVARAWLLRGLVPAVWLWAAAGYGRALRGILFNGLDPDDPRRGPLHLALGTAAMLAFADLGCFGGGTTAEWILGWGVLAVGWGISAWRWSTLAAWTRLRNSFSQPLLWCALPALAVLAAVASLPPGLAWATEFGGYDALSYHLELPREWLAGGSIETLRHNAYSGFPNFTESAFLQMFRLAPGADAALTQAKSPQMLHALLAVAAAWTVAAVAAQSAQQAATAWRARRPGNDDGGRAAAWAGRAVAACVLLGIPWVIVTGSLAYSDMPVLLMLSGAMLAWGARGATGPARLGIALGILLGAAIGAKLTAVGMVVVPFVAWAALSPGARPSWRDSTVTATWAAVSASAALLPWLLRNHAATGSWTFPFALPGTSGTAHDGWWTAEQVARFAAAHAAPAGTTLVDRAIALWNSGFREGIGQAPDADPWLPQWGIAFWAGSAAIGALAWRCGAVGRALAAMFLLQVAFWTFGTHLKPRFLLPCAVPLTVAIAACAGIALASWRGTLTRALAAIALVAWCSVPLAVLRMDARTSNALETCAQLGGESIRIGTGTKDAADAAAAAGEDMPLAWFANWRLPAGAVLGCEGEADVFWCRTVPRTGTVWDGGPLARVLRRHPDSPDAAVAALRDDEGLTHLAIGESMLQRWRDAGWLDPALEPARVRAVAARLRPVARLASGGTVYELPAASPAPAHP